MKTKALIGLICCLSLACSFRTHAAPFGDASVGPVSVTSATTVTTLPLTGFSGVGFNVTSIGTGNTLVAEESKDGGTTWTVVQVYQPSVNSITGSVTATGQYSALVTGGASNLRIRCSVYSTGTVTVSERATVLDDFVVPVSTNVVYNSSAPSVANGASVPAQSDSAGNLKTYLATLIYGEDATNSVLGTVQKPIIASTYSYSVDAAFGTAVTHTSKSTAGLLMGFQVSNVSSSLAWFQVFNSTGSTSGTPILSIPVPAGTSTVPGITTITETFTGLNGLYFSTGITWGVSTVQATYTAGTASNFNVVLTYN